MKIVSLRNYLLLSFLFYNCFAQAAVFHAKADGLWSENGTWLESGVPGLMDEVIIDGFEVTVVSDISVKGITLSNEDGVGDSYLTLEGSGSLTVVQNILVIGGGNLFT